MRVMVTGHRPNKLGGYDNLNILNQLVVAELNHRLLGLNMAHNNLTACSGMALGVDQWFAKLCNDHHIPWIAFLPCDRQWAKWPESSRREWSRILGGCEESVVVCPGTYYYGCMQKRNEAMVDWAQEDRECLCIAVWDGVRQGGTWNCVQYARRKGLTIDIINPNDLKG